MKLKMLSLVFSGGVGVRRSSCASFCCKRAVGGAQPPSSTFQGLSDVSSNSGQPHTYFAKPIQVPPRHMFPGYSSKIRRYISATSIRRASARNRSYVSPVVPGKFWIFGGRSSKDLHPSQNTLAKLDFCSERPHASPAPDITT